MKHLLTVIGIIFISYVITSSAKIRNYPRSPDGSSEVHPLSDEFINRINKMKPLWKAGRNFNPNVSMTYIRGLMGALDTPWYLRLPERKPHRIEGLHIPKEFDSRQKWPNCESINEIRDQGSCGSCWAFATVETITDRFCIASKGTKNFRFSAENLVSCCGILNLCGFGCNGGYPPMAWRYFKRKGIVSGGPYGSNQGCQPYLLQPCEHHSTGDRPNCTMPSSTPSCVKRCETSYSVEYKDDLHFGKETYSVSRNVEQIQIEIMKNGPVAGTFTVYEDFLSYKSGVYHRVHRSVALGGHAIKIIGWGEENGAPYWTVSNSWNTDWGDKGFFKILRGHNECSIEAGINAGIPVV